jgi:nitroreductase
MDAIRAILSRVSTKNFASSQITKEDLNTVLNCGMSAPVGRKRYDTLHLTVIQDKKILDAITDASAMRTPEQPDAPLYNAPTLILVSSKFERTDHIEFANAACVIENMAIAASALGLGSVYLWGFVQKIKDMPAIVDMFDLPQGFVPVSALALGYAVHKPEPSDRPRHSIGINYK